MQQFNLLQAIIQSILTVTLVVMIGVIYWLSRALAQRLPEHQAHRLEQFSRMSVQNVEQQHKNALDKKKLATAFCLDLFKAFKLPAPPPEIVDTAIGSAMYQVYLLEQIGHLLTVIDKVIEPVAIQPREPAAPPQE